MAGKGLSSGKAIESWHENITERWKHQGLHAEKKDAMVVLKKQRRLGGGKLDQTRLGETGRDANQSPHGFKRGRVLLTQNKAGAGGVKETSKEHPCGGLNG